MGEHRQIPPGERRLSMGNGIQGNGWIGDNLLAIFPGDGAVVFQPLRCQSFTGHPCRGGADLVLGFKVDALVFKGVVVDPRIDPEFSKPLIDMSAPGFAPMLQQLTAVPLAHLGAKPGLVHAPHRQHHVGVRLGLSISADVPMHIEVGDHAARDELVPDKVPREINALGLIKLARNGELDLAGKLGIAPLLASLNRIPQALPFVELFGRILWRQNFRRRLV